MILNHKNSRTSRPIKLKSVSAVWRRWSGPLRPGQKPKTTTTMAAAVEEVQAKLAGYPANAKIGAFLQHVPLLGTVADVSFSSCAWLLISFFTECPSPPKISQQVEQCYRLCAPRRGHGTQIVRGGRRCDCGRRDGRYLLHYSGYEDLRADVSLFS